MSTKSDEITLKENSQFKINNNNNNNNNDNSNKINEIKPKINYLMDNDFIYIDEDSETEINDVSMKTFNTKETKHLKLSQNAARHCGNDSSSVKTKNHNKEYQTNSTNKFGEDSKHLTINDKHAAEFETNQKNAEDDITSDFNSVFEKNKENNAISNKMMKKNNEQNVNTKSNEQNVVNNNSSNILKVFNNIDDDDPYNELQEYLEKVKREINDVFEEYKAKNNEIIKPNNHEIRTNTPEILKTNLQKNDSVVKNSLKSCDDHIKELRKRVGDSNETNLSNNKIDSADVNIWANNIIRELDNLVASNDEASNSLKRSSNYKNILRPAKHSTIPLQSFKIDIPNAKVIDKKFQHSHDKVDDTTILKIEENEDDKSIKKSFYPITIRKKQSISCDLNGDNKKHSPQHVWNSDDSILKYPKYNDEDTKSTSSSMCDENSAILSSGKSGNSLDSEYEQNESGIGTATPPKDTTDFSRTSSTNSNLILNRFSNKKLLKCNSISDQDDSLDILSLYDCNANDDDSFDSISQNFADDCIKCSSESVEVSSSNFSNISKDIPDGVVLRRKPELKSVNENHRHAISLPFNRSLKTRSHIIEPTSKKFIPLASASNRDLIKYDDIGSKDSIDTTNSATSILENKPYINELPSLSIASLHSGNDNLNGLMIELTAKSSSAPILIKKMKKIDDQNALRYSRSQSDRYLAEIEAIEACKWLRAAGFPQYAQMYEDLKFPIDLSNVAKDHPILENDPLQSLYRRLVVLNRCANMRLDSHKHPPCPQKDDSDDEGFALSENWEFQSQTRRWSRIGEIGLELNPLSMKHEDPDGDCSSSKESSPERFDEDNSSHQYTGILHHSDSSAKTTDSESSRLKRTGSERLKDGAKAFLKRVESMKSRRRKKQHRDVATTATNRATPSSLDLKYTDTNKNRPVIDKTNINIVFSTPPSPSAVSPIHFYPRNLIVHNNNIELKLPNSNDNFLHPNRFSPKHIPTTTRSCHSQRTSPLHFLQPSTMPHLREMKSDESSYFSDSQDSSAGDKLSLDFTAPTSRKVSRTRRFLQARSKVDDIGAHSDSECHSGRTFVIKNPTGVRQDKVKKLSRGGSLNLGKESKKYRESFQNRSFRGRSSTSKKNKEIDGSKSKKIPVRWHSFQNHDRPESIFKKCCIKSPDDSQSQEEGVRFAAMSCGQLQVIRKLALVTLTGYMERYCPSHRSGWNWELPKFIKKIKTPDYKDRRVFGVPLLLVVQRTSQSLPIGISAAMRWLKINALDQVGLFRKSGVKSRIQKLKESIENLSTYEDCMDIFDLQQAYDVADMLKQYFREVPDSLLTTKMSDTFVAIFQHLPPEARVEAVQAAILLLPDENQDVLHSLLCFLNEVSNSSQVNQMTPSNLAVCLAPSLFNSNIAAGNPVTVSPRRTRKLIGQPNMKELAETKACHECLELMITEYKKIFTASPDRILKCNFGYMEESKPVPLEALGDGMPFHNWRGYLYECTSATIKEGREKSRGWIAVNSLEPNVDIAYKKIGDGHPLRLWRTQTDVEASPNEILQFILSERNIWDSNLLKCQVIKKLDEHTEIFQYVFSGQISTDFCVLRSWQINLPKGVCVIVETSIDHRDAKPMENSIRGIVLASRYLIEPYGHNKSRLMHLARVDLKGKTPEWYNKNYGHICSQYLSKIRLGLRQDSISSENKF